MITSVIGFPGRGMCWEPVFSVYDPKRLFCVGVGGLVYDLGYSGRSGLR